MLDHNTSKATVFDAASEDGADRPVSIGTIVVGGEANNLILSVSDARHPVTFKSIKLNSDDNNAIVDRNTATIDLYSNDTVYLDQYGKELKGKDNKSIVQGYLQSTIKGYEHGVKIETDGNRSILGLTDDVYANPTLGNGDRITVTAASNAVKSSTVKYSIVTAKSADVTTYSKWDNVDKEKSIAYTVVPFDDLSNHNISSMKKQEIVTSNSGNANGTAITGAAMTDAVTGSLAVVSGNLNLDPVLSNAFSVTGEYDGKTITIPSSYYVAATGSAFSITNNTLTAVNAGDLTWDELYDVNTAKLTRIDAVKTLILFIDNNPATTADDVTLKRNVTISDATGTPSDIRFFVDWYQYDPAETTLLPANTVIDNSGNQVYKPWGATLGFGQYSNFQIHVFDQYGKMVTGIGTSWGNDTNGVDVGQYAECTVSDIKENTGDLAHVESNFKVIQNGATYDTMSITGAEIGDTFTLTATIPGTSISKSIKIKVGADTEAYVRDGYSADETFRKTKLGYKK